MAFLRSGRQSGDLAAAPGQLTFPVGEARIPVTVVRSARRRRTIALSVWQGALTVRAPMATTDAEILAVLASRAAWVVARLRAPVPPGPGRLGDTVPYLGRELQLRVTGSPGGETRVLLDGDALHVEAPANGGAVQQEAVAAAMTGWYRSRASELLPGVVARWSARMGLAPGRVLVKDQRRRWGSCGADGTLRLNWRLVLLEPRLAEYVVVHELAHLRHRHHQRPFWEEVARWLPDAGERRRELARASQAMHW